MGIVICIDSCNDCKKNFIKNPYCNGDYTADGVLLRYCPDCGQMFPYLDTYPVEKPEFDRYTMRMAGVAVATKYKLSYREMNSLTKSLSSENFIFDFIENVKATFGLTLEKNDIQQ